MQVTFIFFIQMTKEEKIKRIYEVMWKDRYTIECHNSCWCIIEVPVMIWDVLDWLLTQNINSKIKYWYWAIREKKREPIEKQPDECIEYIYSLTF